MERLQAVRATVDARDQAEILANALRQNEPDVEFLIAHARQLLAYCCEIAEARLN